MGSITMNSTLWAYIGPTSKTIVAYLFLTVFLTVVNHLFAGCISRYSTLLSLFSRRTGRWGYLFGGSGGHFND